MVIIDTTVLVYAVGNDPHLAKPCLRWLRAIKDHEVSGTTTPEVIQEFAHVRARRRGRREAAEQGKDYAQLLSPLTEVTRDHLVHGLELFESVPELGSFDAVLAAVALARGAELVSADKSFSEVPGLIHLTPDMHQFPNP